MSKRINTTESSTSPSLSPRNVAKKNNISEVDAKLVAKDSGHFSMVRNFHLADLLTLCNGACGSLSIFSNMRYLITGDAYNVWIAIFLMPLGAFFDVLDGRVARWRKKSSLLGQELDSLADLISFGVAPAVIAFTLGMRTWLDMVVLTCFICCGIARLARYNATVALLPKDSTGKIRYFEGTPIPTSLFLVFILAWFFGDGRVGEYLPGGVIHVVKRWGLDIHPFVGLYALSGTAMISKTLKIPKL